MTMISSVSSYVRPTSRSSSSIRAYPSAELTLPDDELSDLASCRVAPMLRVEIVMQRLIAKHNTHSSVIEALRAALDYVGLKLNLPSFPVTGWQSRMH